MNQSERTYKRVVLSWTISLSVHFCLFILFLLIRVFMVPAMPEYSEMDFVSVPTVSRPPVTWPPAMPAAPSEEVPEERPEVPPENIKLPEMKHLPQEQPQLFERRVEKITPNDRPFGGEVKPPVRTSEATESYPEAQQSGTDRKPVPDVHRAAIGEKPQPGSSEGEAGVKDRFYSIEGAASSRRVLTEVRPDYPEGLNKEVVIKIRFTVLPNGTIGEMVPVLKGDQTLEDLTMNVFRQWRFNPLPPDLPQEPQSGVITFRYLLK